jgi:hypothetical protein
MDYTDSVFSRPGIFASFGTLLTAYYNFLDEVAPFGMLQNVPLAVWGLFLLAFCERNLQLGGKYRITNLPLWISLLICMASPCFLLHPRYGFPILFTIPYLWCMLLTADTNTES